jgi:hypothetical protein
VIPSRPSRRSGKPAIVSLSNNEPTWRIVYDLIKDHTEYVDPGAAYYEEKYRECAIANLKRKAAKSGMQVVPTPA